MPLTFEAPSFQSIAARLASLSTSGLENHAWRMLHQAEDTAIPPQSVFDYLIEAAESLSLASQVRRSTLLFQKAAYFAWDKAQYLPAAMCLDRAADLGKTSLSIAGTLELMTAAADAYKMVPGYEQVHVKRQMDEWLLRLESGNWDLTELSEWLVGSRMVNVAIQNDQQLRFYARLRQLLMRYGERNLVQRTATLSDRLRVRLSADRFMQNARSFRARGALFHASSVVENSLWLVIAGIVRRPFIFFVITGAIILGYGLIYTQYQFLLDNSVPAKFDVALTFSAFNIVSRNLSSVTITDAGQWFAFSEQVLGMLLMALLLALIIRWILDR